MSLINSKGELINDVYSRNYAFYLDEQDNLHHSRQLFHIPTKNQLKEENFESLNTNKTSDCSSNCIYLCGNSLGLQPRLTSSRIQQYLTTWATQGVNGHFKPLVNSSLPTWIDADTDASERMAHIVGALPSEVAVMQTLTGNLHLLMAAFYKPQPSGRHKIIIESQAFPSDHFVAESQIKHHGFDPRTSLVTITSESETKILSTAQILSVIEEHGPTTSILMFPGIQYYTGQFFDIPKINFAAQKAGIFVIWDLAHAVGNVVLKLHSWNVDAAVWCNYKYLNSGPGAIGGLYIHEKHSQVWKDNGQTRFVDRLSGWWGSDKDSRFNMDNQFSPIPGAAGFQLSNPSILDITSVEASVEVFGQICNWENKDQAIEKGIEVLREKSVRLTKYLEAGLKNMEMFTAQKFHIITPSDPEQRGAQLSLKLELGLLKLVMTELEERGVLVDSRNPDVIRVAPAPLYNTFEDCWHFILALGEALEVAVQAKNKEPTLRHEQTS
ncbi:Kynureninase 2 [Golovinomyces cichoracearum]|uniref:Kynureninase n=1 Tax=Golovinomyces cichoracearum TaxID=62708 RepID=A0A420IL37_9PEZI|nr:Kynureninase 2 [Golovinomyces cichoracearum]